MYVDPNDEFRNEGGYDETPVFDQGDTTIYGRDNTFGYDHHNEYDVPIESVPSRKREPKKSSNVYRAAKKAATKISFAEVETNYRWTELQRIEKKRRDVLLRVEEPIWKILLRTDSTVLQNISTDMLFWFTIVTYVVIRVLAHTYQKFPKDLEDFPSDSIQIVGGFVSFFLVFWVNQSHSRFFQLYNHSMGCKGRIFDVAILAVTSLPYAQASRLVRYMNAAHAAGYVGLSKVYPSCNYFNHINRTMGLLTQQERQRLDDIDLDKGGNCNREIIVWCINDIEMARKKNLVNDRLANQLREQVLDLRRNIGELYNAKDLPIPFFYVHFICLLTTLYLPLFSVTASLQAGIGEQANWISGVVRGLIVVLQAIFVIGLRVLGQKLSDPYGDDLIDLSVMHYVHHTWQMSNRILSSHFPEEASPAVEDALRFSKHRESLGGAWDPRSKRQSGASAASGCESSVAGSSDNFVVPEAHVDLEAQLHNGRMVFNPPIRNKSNQTNHIIALERSRVIFNPAMRESDLNMVSL